MRTKIADIIAILDITPPEHWQSLDQPVTFVTGLIAPSANDYLMPAKGRWGKLIHTPQFEQYKLALKYEWYAAGLGTFSPLDELHMHMVIYFGKGQGGSDLDNRRKPTQDALEGFAFLTDNQIGSYHDEREYDPDNPRCVITFSRRREYQSVANAYRRKHKSRPVAGTDSGGKTSAARRKHKE